MTTPTIGTAVESKAPVEIDVDRLVATRLLIQASSGGGKSFAIRRLLEQTHGLVQHLVLDIEGEFHSLREKFDYVLAGREGGDCPAHPRAAPALARRLLELGVSAVIDLYELKAHERFAFVRGFLDALVNAPRALWRPALIVIDEAHQFCPQDGKVECASAVIDLVTRGRKRGFAAVLATQRLSKLHKDAAAECTNGLIGRCGLDIDMKRAADWLGFSGREETLRLRGLKPGEFFAFGPALSEAVQLVAVGPVKTTHPKVGERATTVAPPREKVREVLARLADIPKEVEAEARSLEEVQRRVRELERELRQARAAVGAPAPELLERARQQGRAEGDAALKKAVRVVEWAIDRVRRPFKEFAAEADRAFEAVAPRLREALVHAGDAGVSSNGTVSIVKSMANGSTEATIAPSVVHVSRSRIEHGATAGNLDRPMQRVLDALAWLEAASVPPPYDRAQVAALAEYAASSGGLRNILSKLNTAGLIEYPAVGQVALTEEGRARATAPATPTTADEIQRRLLDRIDAPMRKCLEPILEAYPNSITRTEVASRAGYEPSSGGLRNLLSRLSTLRAIAYPRPGTCIAESWLFLGAKL